MKQTTIKSPPAERDERLGFSVEEFAIDPELAKAAAMVEAAFPGA